MTIPPYEQRPTAAHVNLDALAGNFRSLREFVGADLKYMAVVKANAYGHGAVRCSRRLESEGVDWFGVATPEEGVELRDGGINKPILCFGSFWPGQEKLTVDYQLTAVVFNEDTARRLNNFAFENNIVLDVHVKIDTGMGRVGIRAENSKPFAELLASMKNLRIDGLMTHFAAAENPVENDFTELQIDRFDRACDAFRAAGHEPKWIDMANSPAAIRHPASRANLIRLGGALFGLLDDILYPETERPSLRPVLSLSSRITDIKSVPKGESLGYGRTFVTGRDSRVALVAIGYADGYSRSLSNRGQASINGVLVPVIGRISMDWTVLDVTDLPTASIGDEVILIGPGVKATDIAELTGTIGYEITCGISPRVPRIYE